MSGEEPEDLLQRLDPDRAAQSAADIETAPEAAKRPRTLKTRLKRGTATARRTPGTSPPAFSPRRYQWLAGLFGLALVIGFSLFQLTSRGTGTAGIPAGKVLAPFAAPLARSSLTGDANLHPACTEADHDSRALNTCLLMKRGPLVLGFFVTGSGACVRSVDAMQAIAGRFQSAGVQFAAVAVRSGPGPARALVRKHGWTIPVAYDRDGAVGESDGVVVCPLLELVRPGGVVAKRLIGGHWSHPAALATAVGALVGR